MKKVLYQSFVIIFVFGVFLFAQEVKAEDNEAIEASAASGGIGSAYGGNADVDAVQSGNMTDPNTNTGTGGKSGKKGGKKGGGENKVPPAIKAFVAPTNSFGMGGLCVGASCSLELGTGTQNDVVWRAIRIIARIAGTVAILFYIAAAFFLITAQDENGVSKGKTLIIYTSLGLVLIFAAYIIVQFVLALIFSV